MGAGYVKRLPVFSKFELAGAGGRVDIAKNFSGAVVVFVGRKPDGFGPGHGGFHQLSGAGGMDGIYFAVFLYPLDEFSIGFFSVNPKQGILDAEAVGVHQKNRHSNLTICRFSGKNHVSYPQFVLRGKQMLRLPAFKNRCIQGALNGVSLGRQTPENADGGISLASAFGFFGALGLLFL
ncbi:MAG: hypothetical protein ACLFTV_08425 [Desulfococcaceae bacterium]